ncbi:hypothetical protein [Mycobacteroides abscessus]|uniref:hypothetical protein n=1 Tax=Mycobacteroides abscessus TaxID=36809 RepID=UPI0006983FF4|nr:hypothetical protein [Mycobacteroides abscessus]
MSSSVTREMRCSTGDFGDAASALLFSVVWLANPETAADLPRRRSRFSVLENQRVFNEAWIPFSLAELGDDESIAVTDVLGFVPYLTEKWPPGGKPHRVEFQRGPRKPPPAWTAG